MIRSDGGGMLQWRSEGILIVVGRSMGGRTGRHWDSLEVWEA